MQRRAFIAGPLFAGLAVTVLPIAAQATPETMTAAINQMTGNSAVAHRRDKRHIPQYEGA